MSECTSVCRERRIPVLGAKEVVAFLLQLRRCLEGLLRDSRALAIAPVATRVWRTFTASSESSGCDPWLERSSFSACGELFPSWVTSWASMGSCVDMLCDKVESRSGCRSARQPKMTSLGRSPLKHSPHTLAGGRQPASAQGKPRWACFDEVPAVGSFHALAAPTSPCLSVSSHI